MFWLMLAFYFFVKTEAAHAEAVLCLSLDFFLNWTVDHKKKDSNLAVTLLSYVPCCERWPPSQNLRSQSSAVKWNRNKLNFLRRYITV